MAKSAKKKRLPKGITLRKDGRYMGRFSYKGETYTLYNRNLDDLKREFLTLEYQVRNDLFTKESTITVNDWFEVWMKEYKEKLVKPGTCRVYRDSFRVYISPSYGKMQLKDMRPVHVQKLYNQLSEKYSRSTIEVVAVVLNGMYKHAYENELIQKNPVSRAVLPRVKSKIKPRVMTLEEQRNFLKYTTEFYCYPIFLLALNTGLRSGELRALQWQDIDFDKKELHVTGTLIYAKKGYVKGLPKTETSQRTVPLNPSMVSLLKSHRKEQMKRKMLLGAKWIPQEDLPDLVFPNEFGRPFNRDRLKRSTDRAIKEVQKHVEGFERITPHTFRHTFATRCIENGIQPQVLKAILGHSKLSMTMDLYAHVLPDAKADEMIKIENIL